MDSIIWAIKHSMRDISDMGLQICVDMLNNFSKTSPNISNAFHQQYFCSILQDILYVLTNSFYSSGFKLQSVILMQMFQMVESGTIAAPLYDVATEGSNKTNQEYLREFVMGLLGSAFPHLNT
jgi:exportin-1